MSKPSESRPWRFFLSSYLTLLREFRNGVGLVRAHHRRERVDVAEFWDGQVIANVGSREGFVDTLVEIWGLTEYTVDGFYTPAAGHVILDVGANVGLFSIWLSHRAPGVIVNAFEPFPENYNALLHNLAGWEHRVIPFNTALGRTRAAGHMIATGERSLDHRLAVTELVDAPSVQVISLADAIALTGSETIDFLKLDVEGAELDIFEGADQETLRRIRRIAIEYHDHIRPGTSQRLKEILQATHRLVSIRGGEYGIMQAELM